MSDAGYIRIYRKILTHTAFRNDAEAMAFAWMVAKAAWQPKTVRYKGYEIALERSELSVSVRDFAEAMDRPKGWAERLLSRLRDHGMITTKNGTLVGTGVGTGGGTGKKTPPAVITICNYEEYQSPKKKGKTPPKTPRKTAARQQSDAEQGREIKEIKEPNGSSPPTPYSEADWPEIPEWMPADRWNAFIEMRGKSRKHPTGEAVKLIIGKLTDWRAQGHDPGLVLDRSTENNWTTIYEPKGERHGNANQSKPPRDNRDGFTRELDRQLGLD